MGARSLQLRFAGLMLNGLTAPGARRQGLDRPCGPPSVQLPEIRPKFVFRSSPLPFRDHPRAQRIRLRRRLEHLIPFLGTGLGQVTPSPNKTFVLDPYFQASTPIV